ncbi:MAG TPA: mycothiol system anti-sigma-R factor, partial [Acidimicrobiales bacterium]|nr:mycothiol system anti-sigma-R factor [Acidimicrobiales bacterium]
MSERTEPDEATSNDSSGRADVETSPGARSVCSEVASAHVDCGTALRELYSYLDGEITVERREDIRVHIEECAPCLDAFDFEVELRQLVARTCQCEAPDALRE